MASVLSEFLPLLSVGVWQVTFVQAIEYASLFEIPGDFPPETRIADYASNGE